MNEHLGEEVAEVEHQAVVLVVHVAVVIVGVVVVVDDVLLLLEDLVLSSHLARLVLWERRLIQREMLDGALPSQFSLTSSSKRSCSGVSSCWRKTLVSMAWSSGGPTW